MSIHISILPIDLLDALSIGIDEQISVQIPSVPHLRLLRLPHPRTGLSSLFLPITTPSGASSTLELHNVAPNARRSWFNDGEILSDGTMLMMTPIDPVFLLVPLLNAASPQDGSLGTFRTFDDIVEDASVKLQKAESTDASTELVPGDIMELQKLPCIHEAMRRLCETKDIATDLVVFRYSHPKLLEYLVKKVTRLGGGNLAEISRTLERELAKDGLMDDGKEKLLQSGRLKLACDLVSQYVSHDIHEELIGKFDFSALTEHLTMLKAADFILDAATTNGNVQKMETDEDQNGKKRKAAGQGSTGVAKLKKANIKGMSKLSSFFQKK